MSCPDLSKAYGIKGYPECSGRGLCVQGLCICDIGWTGVGDMELVRGYDCDIDIRAIYVWSVLNSVLALISAVAIAYFGVKEKIFSEKLRYRRKSIAYMSYIFMNLSGFMIFFTKALDPENHVAGKSGVIGVGIILADFFVSCGISCYFVIFVNFLKGYSRFFDSSTRDFIHDRMIKAANIAEVIPFILLVFISVAVVPVYILPINYSEKFNIVLFATFALGYAFYAYTILPILHICLSEFKKYLARNHHNADQENGSITSVPDVTVVLNLNSKLKKIIGTLESSLIAGAPINILFASWKILSRKQSYLIQLEFSIASIASVALAWSLLTSRTLRIVPVQTKLNTDIPP